MDPLPLSGTRRERKSGEFVRVCICAWGVEATPYRTPLTQSEEGEKLLMELVRGIQSMERALSAARLNSPTSVCQHCISFLLPPLSFFFSPYGSDSVASASQEAWSESRISRILGVCGKKKKRAPPTNTSGRPLAVQFIRGLRIFCVVWVLLTAVGLQPRLAVGERRLPRGAKRVQ